MKQVLAQTQALERVQEAARRQGDTQQQTFAGNLSREADARGHRVTEADKTPDADLEPGDERKREPDGGKPRNQDKAGAGEETPEPEEDLGRHLDVRA